MSVDAWTRTPQPNPKHIDLNDFTSIVVTDDAGSERRLTAAQLGNLNDEQREFVRAWIYGFYKRYPGYTFG